MTHKEYFAFFLAGFSLPPCLFAVLMYQGQDLCNSTFVLQRKKEIIEFFPYAARYHIT